MVAKLKPREDEPAPARPHAPDRGHRHRPSEVAGVKSGVVVDLDRAEQAHPAGRRRGRAHGRADGRFADRQPDGRPAEERQPSRRPSISAATRSTRPTSSACWPPAPSRRCKAEREVVHSLPVGFSLDGERGVRDPRGMVGDALGVDMHVLTGDARAAAQSRALHQPLASVGRAHGGDALCQRPGGAGRRRARDGRRLHRHGRRHDDDLGLRRRQVRPCRRHRRSAATMSRLDLARGLSTRSRMPSG